MGGGIVRHSLNKSELIDFKNVTSFSDDIIITLHEQYTLFSSIIKDDGVIDYGELCQIIGKKDNTLTWRIFDLIDSNGDKRLNFREFIKFISCFLTGSEEEQIFQSFQLFADRQENVIKRETMIKILIDTISQEETLREYLDESTLKEIVINTFDNTCIETISMEMYKEILNKNPNILKWLRLDVNKIKECRRKKREACFV